MQGLARGSTSYWVLSASLCHSCHRPGQNIIYLHFQASFISVLPLMPDWCLTANLIILDWVGLPVARNLQNKTKTSCLASSQYSHIFVPSYFASTEHLDRISPTPQHCFCLTSRAWEAQDQGGLQVEWSSKLLPVFSPLIKLAKKKKKKIQCREGCSRKISSCSLGGKVN